MLSILTTASENWLGGSRLAAVPRCKGGRLPVRLARKSRATLILASSMRPTRITSSRRQPRDCSRTTADRVTTIRELDTTTSAQPARGRGRDRGTAGRGTETATTTSRRTEHRTMSGLPARRTVSAGSRHVLLETVLTASTPAVLQLYGLSSLNPARRVLFPSRVLSV